VKPATYICLVSATTGEYRPAPNRQTSVPLLARTPYVPAGPCFDEREPCEPQTGQVEK
jgi:hypothetical protein